MITENSIRIRSPTGENIHNKVLKNKNENKKVRGKTMNELFRINDENKCYTSMRLATREDKKQFFNAVQNAKHKLSEFINQKIEFVNVYMQLTELKNDNDDTTHTAVKTVLITPDGKGIYTTSNGVANSLYQMFSIFGTPDTWDGEIMTVYVRQIETKNGRTFILEVTD